MKYVLIFMLAFVWLPVPHAQSASPTVGGVDPPSWWIGHSMSEIQLLVRGSNLGGCVLSASSPAVTIIRQQVNDAGTYVIAYARIAPDAKPGDVTLTLRNASGVADTHFGLLALPDRTGRFAGIGPDDVIYLVMPDRFDDGDRLNNGPNYDRSNPHAYHGGDFKGLAARLPYLKDLGVTTIWMTPVYDNNDTRSDYHGYGATDCYRVEEHFGTMGDLRALVDQAHRLGLKVMQDQVANHVGATHPWVDSSPTPTWFNGTASDHLDNPFKIDSITDISGDAADRKATLEGWFANKLPDLNQDDPEVAQYLIQNSIWWVDQAGFDAIREDTLPYAPRSFWSQWILALKAEHPNVTVLGEVFHGDPKVVSYFQGGVARDGIDSRVDYLFDFPLGFSMIGFFSRQASAERIGGTLELDTLYPNARGLAPFLGNHDTPRPLALVNGDTNALKLAQTCLLTMRGMPQIYYGDEIAMPGGEDPDNRRDFPGGFAGDTTNCFVATGRTPTQQSVFSNLRTMLALRRGHPSLRGAETRVLAASGTLFVYMRGAAHERAIVALNNGDVELPVDVDCTGVVANNTRMIDALSLQRRVRVTGGRLGFRLPAHTAAIFFVSDRLPSAG